MKYLLVVTSALEAGAGVALLGFPSATITLLLGSQFDAMPSLTIVRVVGAVLFALGIGCGLASRNVQSTFARGMAALMAVYNPVAALALAVIGMKVPSVGILLWPAVALHAAMALWCLGRILRRPASSPEEARYK